MGSTENQFGKLSINNEEDDAACLYAIHLSTSFTFHMVLKAAIELDLFEIIARAGPGAHLSPSEIASHLPTKNPDAPYLLDRMLRLLTTYSLLTCSVRTGEDGSVQRLYGISPAGKFYVRNEDGYSLGSVPLFSLYRPVAEVWFHLKDAVLEEGINLFEKVNGKTLFEFMETDPKVNKLFSDAMVSHSGIALKKVLETYKGFEGVSVLVDVAGGFGATLNMIISKYPSIKGINFDLPQVIKQAPSYSGIEHVEGDMFESVPNGDAIVLKCTCHDWSDEQCIKLLKNCHKALHENGKVIIVDYIMPEVPESSIAAKHISVYDNGMVFNLGGKERTEKEFEFLSKSSGFSGFKVACLAYNALGVIELYK
ncbi:caffeic acid 3-O-methyltransferase-like [Corylus avellana]|uniref:caffeic acid 3-O-methyltransferase-like n=1 Tax=Corylus avellana TaxID=13451 RepID=UPI00286D4467|nr:caffeic acid 3-O-methyltransferase-like [Corylus avellana]